MADDAITVTQADIFDAVNTIVEEGFAVGCCVMSPTDGHEFASYLSKELLTRTTSLAAHDGLDQKELPEVAAMRFIEILRSDIAASVTILTDNEDANYKSEQVAIEVCAEWTNWRDYRIYGESVLQCLAKAVGEREALSAIRENKS